MNATGATGRGWQWAPIGVVALGLAGAAIGAVSRASRLTAQGLNEGPPRQGRRLGGLAYERLESPEPR